MSYYVVKVYGLICDGCGASIEPSASDDMPYDHIADPYGVDDAFADGGASHPDDAPGLTEGATPDQSIPIKFSA